MQTKICTKCNIEKTIIEFSKKKKNKDGLQYECKQCCKEIHSLYRQDNKEHLAEYNKQHRQNNNKYYTEYRKNYYQDNKECLSVRQKQYRQTPQGKASSKANQQNRRAAKLNNGGKHTAKQILELFELQSNRCPYCKTKLFKSGANKYHVDHIVPLSKCGSNDISNIQLLCAKCNHKKSDKLPEDFAQQHGKLL